MGEKRDKTMIKGIIFDLEGTFWRIEADPAAQEEAAARGAMLAGYPDGAAFTAAVGERYAGYLAWAEREGKEAGDFGLWHDWLLPDLDEEYLHRICHDLTAELRKTEGIRRIVPGSLRAVRTLYDRGYRLGIVSNLVGEREIPLWLEESGVKQYFEAVVLSPVCRIRRPNPAIYRLACEELGLEPGECASVSGEGCDAAGEKEAGIAVSILLTEGGAVPPPEADHAVSHFSEIPELPELRQSRRKERTQC